MRGSPMEWIVYGGFWDKDRNIPVSFSKTASIVENTELAYEYDRICALENDLRDAYRVATHYGSSDEFWRLAPRMDKPADSVFSRWLRSKEKCHVQILAMGCCSIMCDINLQFDFEWLILAAMAVASVETVRSYNGIPIFKTFGSEMFLSLMSDLCATLSEWPIREPAHPSKWHAIAEWVNGYLAMANDAWESISRPKVYFVTRAEPLTLPPQTGVVPQHWKNHYTPDGYFRCCYPPKPSLVLIAHADKKGEIGPFYRARRLVESLLKQCAPARTLDVSGIFWNLQNLVVDWAEIDTINITDNFLRRGDLPQVERLVGLCPTKKLIILAGNLLDPDLLKKKFPGITIR